MNASTLTALTVAGMLALSALPAYSSDDAPVDKGGMPPSTEMNAGPSPDNALPPGAIERGNGGDADGSSIYPKTANDSGTRMGSQAQKPARSEEVEKKAE
jgi:hypothetical protein